MQQKVITDQLENEITKIESRDLMIENKLLKDQLESYKSQFIQEKSTSDQLTEENKQLKNSLYEQLYNEKLSILKGVNKRLDAYYAANSQSEINRLTEFERNSRRKLHEILQTLKQNRIQSEDEIYAQLRELEKLLETKVTEARIDFEKKTGIYSQNRTKEFQKLHEESLTEEEMKNILKKNNVESLIGLNIFNKLGVLFVVIGMIAAMQFTYVRLSDLFKCIFAFLVGALLLLGGEILNRKKSNIFSLGITSSGVAISYVAVAISYFGLNILNMYVALGLCIGITLISFFLSQRYHSQTIAIFAMIGGYLPIASIAENKALVYSAMVYFIILNILALSFSFHKKWSASAFVGFILNVFGTTYIMNLVLWSWPGLDENNLKNGIPILFIVFSFVIYTLIPLISTYVTKSKFIKLDIILLGLNTYISAILLYLSLYRLDLASYLGLVAVVFALVYFFLGKIIKVYLVEEKQLQALFYITSFVFVILIIPFQFDKVWLSIGWLVEGVALVIYGIIKDNKKFQKYGYIANALSLTTFLLLDIFLETMNIGEHFIYKYFMITIGSILIMSAYVYKKRLSGAVKFLKYGCTINIWIFMIYFIRTEVWTFISNAVQHSPIDEYYLVNGLCISIGFLLAYFIPRIKILSDRGMRGISKVIYLISILWLTLLTSEGSPFLPESDIPVLYTILGSLLIIILGLLSVLAVKDVVKAFVLEQKIGIQWHPLLVSLYSIFILTQNLITQYHLEFTNGVISIIYILTAFSWIVYGFVKKYGFIRKWGLGLSFLAITKLFLLDLSFLSKGYQIISYFAFGITLIAISFVYQYFNKRLNIKTIE